MADGLFETTRGAAIRGYGQAMQRRWIVLAAAAVVALGALIGVGALLGAPAQDRGTAAIGGAFRLTDQHGARVSSDDFAGRYMLIYFGYTFCPDFCPLSLQVMSHSLDQLPPQAAAQVVPVFITVDPERDTVEQLASYAPLFHPGLVALTGSDAEIAAAARAYRVHFAKAQSGEGEEEPYGVDHSTFMYLMGPDGAYVTHFGHTAKPEDIAERLKRELGVS
jgi:cytochrome oxidase Cu insertion factor (SCO1/SenC/PrrC family)